MKTNFTRKMRGLMLGALAMASLPAHGQYQTIDLGDHVNFNLFAGSNVSNEYPVAPATITIDGVPFALAPKGNDSLGIIEVHANGEYSIDSLNIYGATTLYSLANSFWGATGKVNATIEVFGTNGAYASFDLEQGDNLRDFYNGYYNNSAPNVVTMPVDTYNRIDRQQFDLPASFLTETLTEIRLNGAADAGNPNGQVFVMGLTVAVPEPTSALLGGMGLLLLLRRRR